MKNKFKIAILIILFILSIGYASIYDSLKLSLSTNYSINLEDLDLYVSSIYIDNIYSNSVLNTTRDQFTVSSKNSVVKYSLTNNSFNYDINAKIVCTNSDTITLNIEQQEVILAQETVEGIITIDNPNDIDENFNCEINRTYIEREVLAQEKKVVIFDAVDGSVDVGYKIIDGNTYGELPIAKKTLYSFVGWFTSEQNGNEIKSSNNLTSLNDEILYAYYERPKAPVLSLSTTEWSNTSVDVSIKTPGSGVNDVKEYEYFITNENIIPDDSTEVTGVTNGKISITDNGKWYVYYRTITSDDAVSVWSEGVTAKIDKTGPNIISIETSDVIDIETEATFVAQDKESYVKYYNVVDSNTTPTEWIPVTDFVEEETPTKYKHGASWAKVFSHNALAGKNFFQDEAEVLSVNDDYKYSVLKNIEKYRNSSNYFEFLLEYPEHSQTEYNRWKQTANLTTEIVSDGTGSEFAKGYSAINIDWDGVYWGGLTRSTNTLNTYIDGSVGHNNWFYSIGTFKRWREGIPGPHNYNGISNVFLWNRIDDKNTTKKETIKATIGSLNKNKDYYLFVKDSLGNISSKKFTISNIGDSSLLPPYVTGDSGSWTTSKTLYLTEPFSVEGIDHYEYYISDSYSIPDKSVTPTGSTKSSSLTITTSGTYIYFKSVGSNGLIGEWSIAKNLNVDSVKPKINSTTSSITTDLTNYMTFNATDAGSQIKYYNVSSSTTAPTTWIPVTDFVESKTATKYANGASWARVFHHNARSGTVLFANANEALSSSVDDKYSVLKNIENYRNASKYFEFLLEYPDLSSTQYNRWKQTLNPTTETIPDGTGNEVATGYSAVHIDWTDHYWGGIAKSTYGSTFIDGSVGHNNWYYAIGCFGKWSTSIPGPSTAINIADLWIRIDDKETTTSANLTATIGGLTKNGTYYIHVKDAAGNISYKAFTISKIG